MHPAEIGTEIVLDEVDPLAALLRRLGRRRCRHNVCDVLFFIVVDAARPNVESLPALRHTDLETLHGRALRPIMRIHLELIDRSADFYSRFKHHIRTDVLHDLRAAGPCSEETVCAFRLLSAPVDQDGALRVVYRNAVVTGIGNRPVQSEGVCVGIRLDFKLHIGKSVCAHGIFADSRLFKPKRFCRGNGDLLISVCSEVAKEKELPGKFANLPIFLFYPVCAVNLNGDSNVLHNKLRNNELIGIDLFLTRPILETSMAHRTRIVFFGSCAICRRIDLLHKVDLVRCLNDDVFNLRRPFRIGEVKFTASTRPILHTAVRRTRRGDLLVMSKVMPERGDHGVGFRKLRFGILVSI